MKRCPECRRDYYDDTLLYCLDDGNALLQGPASAEEPGTAILPGFGVPASGGSPSETATQPQIDTTDQTAILPNRTGNIIPKPRGFDKRLLAAPFLLAAIVLSMFFGYRYVKPAGTEQVNSIAVLPFENKSGTADTDYLSDGLADSLIYRLSQLPNLKVSPTSSVMRYRGKETDVAQIAKELEVDAVMSGRLVQRNDDLSISVQLIDSRTRKLIWAEQYDRKMADLLATQREIATTITQKLQLKLAGSETKGITKKYTDSNEAYQSYLKGRYYWSRRTAENIKKAIEQFKAATDRDSNFALAYAGLADCYVILPEYAGIPSSETIPQATLYAERSIGIDDQLAEPHASLGQVYRQSWQWERSEQEFKRAIELNSNYATAYHWYSHTLRALGRFDEAATIIKRGHEIDPLSSIIGVNLSEIYLLQDDFNASIETNLKVIELDPNFSEAYRSLGLGYLKLGRNAEAIASLEKAVELTNRSSVTLMNLGYGYSMTEKRAEAIAVVKELEQKHARKESPGLYIAGVYASLGDKDKAFEWLENDFRSRNGELSIIRWRVQFQSLRNDPRYRDLLKRMGLPE